MENEVRIPIVVELVVRIKIEAEGAEVKTAATVPVIRQDTTRRLAEYEPKLPPLFDDSPKVEPYGVEKEKTKLVEIKPEDIRSDNMNFIPTLEEMSEIFKCEFCGTIFGKEISLRIHKHKHTSENARFNHAAEIDKKKVEEKAKLIDEILVPGDPTKFASSLQCPQCGYVGKNKASIAQHRSKRHGFGRSKDPWLESDNRITDKVNSHLTACPNPNCIGGKTFVRNVGFRANGLEWCSQKCFDNYLPPAPKAAQ